MATRRRQQFIVGNVAWMLATILVLASRSSLPYELLFVVSLIGFLVVTVNFYPRRTIMGAAGSGSSVERIDLAGVRRLNSRV